MPERSALPTQLLNGPFTVAEAAALGVGPDVLRGARFRSLAHGVHVRVDHEDGLVLRCQALALVLPPDAVFSHLTAARLCHLPVPGRCGPLGWPADEPLEVTCSQRAARHDGVHGHVGQVTTHVRRIEHGLRVTSGAKTWADLAPRLGLDDLVVLGDAALRHGWADLVELTDMAARPGRRGSRRMRAAIPLLEPRTDSPMETRLRLLLVRAGLPRPQAGRDVVVDGEWLARPDLSYPSLRIAIEFDGDHHRTSRAQWQRDIGRRRMLEDAGWLLIVLTADDLFRHPELTVARVRRAVVARTPH